MSFLFRCVQSGTTVVFLTGGCFCLNCASLLFYSGGLIRSKAWMGKTLSHGWFFDLIFSLECFINAISDFALLIAVAYKTRDLREGFPIDCLTGTLKGFILWNTFSVVACWTASCALYYERDHEYSGVYPYFFINDTALVSNATSAALVNQAVVPTLTLLYISATLIATLKLLILYAVYFGYLQAVTQEAMVNDPFVLFAREQDMSLSSTPQAVPSTNSGFQGGGRSRPIQGLAPARNIPADWGQPSQTSFRPRSEWSSSESRHNPFPENRDERLSGHQVISSPQPSYPLERWSRPDSAERPYADPSMGPAASNLALTAPAPPCGTVGPAVTQLTPATSITGPPGYDPSALPPAPPGVVPLPYQLPAAVPTAFQPGPYYAPQPTQTQPLSPSTSPMVPIYPALATLTTASTENPQVVRDESNHRGHKRNRKVSIMQSPSVTTFSPTDSAAQVGADNVRESSRSSSEHSQISMSEALGKLLDTLPSGNNSAR